jgi:hypothetical protein
MSIEFLRSAIGIIGIACAFMTARAAGAIWKGRPTSSRLTGWVIRTVLCMVAVAIRHPLNRLDLIVWSLAAVAFAAGWWAAAREEPPEDLTRQIFPDEE